MNEQVAVTALSAIAHEGRLAIFRLLVQSADAVAAGDIAAALAIPASTLSFHLKALQQAGLIVVRQEGRFMYYSPNREAFNSLLAYLTENCCGGGGCPITHQGESRCQA
jgi:DNA-binding transcriptional ArsR family regulator